MNAEEINKKIQTEKDSFNCNVNRLQKQIFELKQRHQRTMEYWQRQKVLISKTKQNETLNIIPYITAAKPIILY